MSVAALALARRGMPIFPLAPDLDATGRWEKRPMVPRGFYSASVDPAQIRQWWRWWPHARPAIATGHPLPDPVTGEAMGRLLVVDVDTTGRPDAPICGPAALDALAPILPPTVAVETGSGGLHLYYLAPLDAEITIGQIPRAEGLPRCAVDWRCRLGYVVAPGATHPVTGRPWRWLREAPAAWPNLRLGPLAAAPPALLAACARRSPPPSAPLPPAALSEDARQRRYGDRALSATVARLRDLTPGERHRASFGPICGLGALIAGGCLDAEPTRAAVVEALLAAQLDTHDAQRLADRALRAGMATPKRAPERV